MSYKYLITGGAGFIGSNIVAELLARGQLVRVLDNFSTGRRDNVQEFYNHPNFELIEGDLRSFHIVRKAVTGIDFVLHQGALPSVPRSIDDPITTNDVNILGTLNILEAARESKVKRVVYASSSSVYGNNPTLPKTEDLPVAPLSPYALSKYTGERYCQNYYSIYGLETVCLRYFNVFGPNQDPNSQYSAVIPKFVKQIQQGESPTIYGDGNQSRDFTYVSNNVEANILACFQPDVAGEVFNIACGNRYSLRELVDAINRILGTNVGPVYAPERVGDVKHSQASIAHARKRLKFQVDVEFLEGVRRVVATFAKNLPNSGSRNGNGASKNVLTEVQA